MQINANAEHVVRESSFNVTQCETNPRQELSGLLFWTTLYDYTLIIQSTSCYL